MLARFRNILQGVFLWLCLGLGATSCKNNAGMPPTQSPPPSADETQVKNRHNPAEPPICGEVSECKRRFVSTPITALDIRRIAASLCALGQKAFCTDSPRFTQGCTGIRSRTRLHRCRLACIQQHPLACADLWHYAADQLSTTTLPAIRQFSQTATLHVPLWPKVVLRALPGAQILVVSQDDTQSTGFITAFGQDYSQHQYGVMVKFPTSALSAGIATKELPRLSEKEAVHQLQDTRGDLATCGPDMVCNRIVFNHYGKVFTLPDTQDDLPSIQLACGPLEIVEQKTVDGTLQSRVRQIVDGIEMTGWSHSNIQYNFGIHHCFNRIQQQQIKISVVRPGTTPTVEPGRIPEGYVTWDESVALKAADRLKKVKKLYTFGVEGCDQWHLDEQNMEQRTPDKNGVKIRGYGIKQTSAGFTMSGPYYEYRSKNGEGQLGATSGLAHYMTVSHDKTSIRLVSAMTPPLAYHPDDVTVLFTNKKACDRAWRENPRCRISEATCTFVPRALRLFGGI